MKELLGLLRGADINTANFFVPIEANRTLRVGSDPANDFVIKHNLISPCHCEITSKIDYQNDITIIYLTDLSANGTYLNGSYIGVNRTVVLVSGSTISFASRHLRMIYIERKSNIPYDEEQVEVEFVPGALYYPDRENHQVKKDVKNTSKLIGSGAQADVFLAYDRLFRSNQLACKRVHLTRNMPIKHIIETETNILRNNRHVNVLSLVTLLKTEEKIYFFLPLYTGGTLSEKMNERMSERNATFIFKQILSGLQYIHEKGIIHCDLKAENILLGSTSELPRVIISDFGLSMLKLAPKMLWPECGTFNNYAPEIFDIEPMIDEKVDCWAAGLILYAMLFGSHPFMQHTDTTIIEDVNIEHSIVNDEPVLDGGASFAVKHIVSKLLEKDPDQRYSCEQCLKSNWIQWSTELDSVRVHKEFQFERQLWFQDEENPYTDNCVPDGDLMDDDLMELRSTQGRKSILRCNRPITLDAEIDQDLFQDIRRFKYPKRLLENFKTKLF